MEEGRLRMSDGGVLLHAIRHSELVFRIYLVS